MDQEEHPDDHAISQEVQQHLQLQDQLPLQEPASSPEGFNDPISPADKIETNKTVYSTSDAMSDTNASSVRVADWCPSDKSATNPTKPAARLTGDNIFVHDLLYTGSGAVDAAANHPDGVTGQSADHGGERIHANSRAGAAWEQFDEDKVLVSDCDDLTYSTVQL